jgi:23S rRNA pseudouridine2457 synthase
MYQYYLFYKPYQVLCQFSPEGDKVTLAAHMPDVQKDVYPVGRLDYDSEGLLLLTNDKAMTHRLLEPKFEHKRTYWVQVEGCITSEATKELEKGVVINIDGKAYKTKPSIAAIMEDYPELPERTPPIRFRKNIPTSWLSLTLTEGKNRQVRKMTAAVGFPTLRLVRFSIGKLHCDGLKSGELREIKGIDIEKLLFS